MITADYNILHQDDEYKFIILEDLNLGSISITNSIERIIENEGIEEYRVFYYDSEGILTRYIWQDDVFHDFMGEWTKDLDKVINKIKTTKEPIN